VGDGIDSAGERHTDAQMLGDPMATHGMRAAYAFEAKYRWLDPGKFICHASPAIVFLQYGRKDLPFLTQERAREYVGVVSEPKKFQLYEAPHALNAEARRDRLAFLAEQLKLKPLSPSIVAAILELYQPPDQEQ